MSREPDDPTEVLGDDEDPTRNLDSGDDHPAEHIEDHDEETRQLDEPGTLEPGTAETDILMPSMATGSPEELRTRRLAEEGPPAGNPPPVESGDGDGSRQRGLWMLGISIVASILLVSSYIAAGGLDYKPSDTADPCDARPWSNPGSFEETVQQFALSASDGAACELGVSREELVGVLADDQSRAEFAEENGLSESEIDDALRSGLNRAIDDAQNADAISPLVATGLKAAVRVLPTDQLIPLIEDASGLLDGGSLDGLSGIIDGVTGGLNGDSGSLGDSLPDNLPGDITDGLREQLPDELQQAIPDSVDDRIKKELNNLLNP